jgi:hypothetical protein
LVDFISIPSAGAHWRCEIFFTQEKVVEGLNRECLKLIKDTTFQDFAPENLPESEHYVDWAAGIPLLFFTAALLRRTTPSYYDNDWHNLENEFASKNEAQAARAFLEKHGESLPATAYSSESLAIL